jgi:hypothetical protein
MMVRFVGEGIEDWKAEHYNSKAFMRRVKRFVRAPQHIFESLCLLNGWNFVALKFHRSVMIFSPKILQQTMSLEGKNLGRLQTLPMA